MLTLPSLRKQLETAVLAARRAAESAARAAIEGLGVFADRRPEHLDADQAALRNGLRAKWRQLGGDPELLTADCAYEQWHRLLFARFLAENQLLLHPKYRVAVTLADCEELRPSWASPMAGRWLHGSHPRSLPIFALTIRASGCVSPRGPPRAGADPRRAPSRGVHLRRRARVGVPVLAEGQEGRSTRPNARSAVPTSGQ